jgi:regulator of sigma E protease
LLAGILIFSLVFVKVGAPDPKVVQIVGVSPDSPASFAGIQNGDIVLSVNEATVTDTQNLSDLIRQNLGKQVSISIKRNGQQVVIKTTPRVNPPQGQGPLGVLLGNPIRQINWFESIPFAAQMTYEQIKQMALLPGRLIAGSIPADQARVVGPVGMFDIYQQARQRDNLDQAGQNPQTPAVNTLLLMAFISVALGITNLLPIPALDGGRILFVLPEIITHRRVKPEFENTVHMVGFALLILVLVVITTNDFLNPIALP